MFRWSRSQSDLTEELLQELEGAALEEASGFCFDSPYNTDDDYSDNDYHDDDYHADDIILMIMTFNIWMSGQSSSVQRRVEGGERRQRNLGGGETERGEVRHLLVWI